MLTVRALAAESGLELAAGVAVADGHELAPVALGQRLRADGTAVSRVSGSAELRRSFHEARLALEAAALGNGQWERAARELFCHRHTLRYRIREDLFPELERRNCRFSTEVDALR